MTRYRMGMSNPDAYLVPKEGAYRLGIGQRTLYQWLRGPNPPPYVRRGRLWLLPRDEFDEWAKQKVIR